MRIRTLAAKKSQFLLNNVNTEAFDQGFCVFRQQFYHFRAFFRVYFARINS